MREIILLEVNPADGGQIRVNAVFWFAITDPAAQIKQSSFASAVNANQAGAAAPTQAELGALQSGAVREEWKSFVFPNTYTAAQIKADLQSHYASRQSYLASLPAVEQWYGVSWDGTNWTA